MIRIYAIFLRQVLLIRRSIHRLLGIFYWALLDLLLWGFLTVYLHKVGQDRLSGITVLIGTVVLWNFLMRVQQGVGVSFLEDVWARNLMSLLASPLSIREYMSGLVVVGTTSAFFSLAIMTAVAWLLFSYNIFQFGFLMIPFVAILFLFGLGLGIFTTAMILRFGPSSEILAWSIPALIPPFSGVFYPVATLPKALQYIAFILPSSHVFEGMRAAVFASRVDWQNLILGFLLAFLFVIASFFFLHRSYRYVLRNGLLTRFSTE